MKIIGILGPAGSGKTTVANYLTEKYGAKKYSFAEPLKEIARHTLGFTDDQLYGSQSQKETIDPRYGFSPRWFLQRLGTEGVRNVMGENFWWQYCLARIYVDKPALAVIEDVRFVNEATGLLFEGTQYSQHPTFIWRLESPAESTADPEHQSEAEWSRAPYTHLVKPKERNLISLFDEVDDVAIECELTRAKLVLA